MTAKATVPMCASGRSALALTERKKPSSSVRNNRYDKAVREWHKLMRRRPPKRYRTDHRGRGGQTAYMLRERLEPAVTTTTDAVAAPSTAAAAASTQPEPDEETDYETDYEDEGLATEGMYNDDDSDGGFGYDF